MEFLPQVTVFLAQNEGTAETTAYMIAGFAIIFGVMALYLSSIAIRTRNQKREMELLDSIAQEKESN